MTTMFTHTLMCDGDCGGSIQVIDHNKGDETMAVAELLGWKTVTVGKKTDVYCRYCQALAKKIHLGQ